MKEFFIFLLIKVGNPLYKGLIKTSLLLAKYFLQPDFKITNS